MNTDLSFFDSLWFRLRSVENRITQYRLGTNETVVAETEYGKIKGAKRFTIYDDTYYSFEKIPYAQPPINELRFKAPVPPKPWEDVLDCTQGNPRPMQLHFAYNKVDGTEDCLYLNVYTNNMQPEKPRPVMIWIYGGGFVLGEANRDWYSPELLMKKDVVLVTLNYRLGPFGFLSLKDPAFDIPGNAGLKDQVMAIKWVKKNCAQFGGDPNNITVFGESAGAASTNYMSITEQTNGLFHRAILMSGCSITPWAITSMSDAPYRLAKWAGYKGEDNEKDVLEFLQKAKARDLIVHDDKLLTEQEQMSGILFCFGPVIEPYLTSECVIPKAPREMLKTAWSNKIPMMVGATSLEGLIFYPALKKKPEILKLMETCTYLVPTEVVTDRESSECVEMGQKLKSAHVRGESPDLMYSFLNLVSVKHFWDPLNRFIQARFKYSEAPTYLYRFDFESVELVNPYYIMRLGKATRGVSHADELTYLFHTLMGRKMNKNSREYKTIERMISIWTEFAAKADPNCEVIESLKWKPLEKDATTYECLNISDDVDLRNLPEMDAINVWASLYPKDFV